MKRKIGIIGGGILGMTLALRLSKAGLEITLIETSESLGGLASSQKIGGYTWDRFYHVMLLSDANLLSLLEQLELTDQIHWGETKTGFLTEGRLYSMSNTMEFLSFPPLKLLNKLRLGLTIFYASKIKSWQRLEAVKTAAWLKKLCGRNTFDKIWLPLLKSKLGDGYKKVNAVFIWAIISRMYAARRSGLKKEMFGYVEGGYATVLQQFKRLLDDRGVQTVCKTPVTKITKNDLDIEIATKNQEKLKFDAVILTTPCAHIPELCHQLTTSQKKRFTDISYQGIISASILLKKPLAGYYITNITDEWIPFTSVIEMTSLVDKTVFGGNSFIYLPRYVADSDDFWNKSDEDIKYKFLTALFEIYPSIGKNDILDLNISRARHVLPMTTLNYSTKHLPATHTSVENIFVVNSAQIPNGTMNINEIIGLANRKAKEIIELISP